MDALQIRAQIAQAQRRRDAALQRIRELESQREVCKQPADVPLVSACGLVQRSALKLKDSSLPCELWPFVYSSIARASVPEAVLCRLRQVLPGQRRQRLPSPDRDFQACLLELCRILTAALCGHQDFNLELDEAWLVTQNPGDYFPPEAHRSRKSREGFSCIMDLDLPPALSCENHERPTKGSYGFHDGLHNLLWKGDRTTDKDDLVQPGIIQLELRVGQLYVFPDFVAALSVCPGGLVEKVQTLTYPFPGEGTRRWIEDSEDAREPPSPSSFHDEEIRRSARRSWSKRQGSETVGALPRPNPDVSCAWMEVADEPSVDWLRGFLSKYRMVHAPRARQSTGGSVVAPSRRVMDFILPEEAKVCKDFMQRFLQRLEERERCQIDSRIDDRLRKQVLRSGRTKSVPPKDGQRATKQVSEKRLRARSTGSEETPEVVAAVARARRRATDEKRRQVKVEEATAKALQKERYGKRDERLARFSEEKVKQKRQQNVLRQSPSRSSFGAGLGLASEHLDLLLSEDLDLM